MRFRRRTTPQGDGATARVAELERRLQHLEAAFEGLQDSVHREFVRQDKHLQQLTETTRPDAMARSLSDDARRRGV